MTTTLRIDDSLKRECDAIFKDLGLTMTGAVTVFLHQVARTRTIPFVIGDTAPPERRWTGFADGAEAWRVFERGRAMRLAKGTKPWTMDEINAEIDAMHASGETPIAKAAML